MNHQKELQRRRRQKAVRLHRKMVRRSDRPRLAVYRSNRFIYAQVIDDRAGRTVAAASSLEKELHATAAPAEKASAAAPSEGGKTAGDAKPSAGEGKPSRGDAKPFSGKIGVAHKVGLALAERAKKAGIEKVVFDRRHYRFHGRIKALADGARKGGLSF